MKALTELHAETRQGRHRRDCRSRSRGDAASRPAESPASNHPSSPRSLSADVSPGDLFGLSLDPALAELADEFSRRLLTGETVDVDRARGGPSRARPTRSRSSCPSCAGSPGSSRSTPARATAAGASANGPAAGKVFADFHIVREIGRGGMGIVFEARQTALGRRVALKVLPQAAAMDPKALKRFQLEAQVAGLLQHPHIVPVHAVGTVDGVPYFAMQYIEGGSLAGLIAELRGLVERGADHVVSASSGDSPSALALGLLTGRFAPSGRESDLRRRADVRHPGRASLQASRSPIPAPGRRDWPSRKERAHVGWRRTIRRIVRPTAPTDTRGDSGGPLPDESGIGTTLRPSAADTVSATAPQSIRGRRFTAPSPGWASRRPRHWVTPTTRVSCTATSSRPTCCSTAAATCGSPTSAWPTCKGTRG